MKDRSKEFKSSIINTACLSMHHKVCLSVYEIDAFRRRMKRTRTRTQRPHVAQAYEQLFCQSSKDFLILMNRKYKYSSKSSAQKEMIPLHLCRNSQTLHLLVCVTEMNSI